MVAMAGENTGRVLVRRLIIRNFKSIRELELGLSTGLNVLVGANAAGKTNVLEAVAFMRRALVDAAEKVPYRPHVPGYWSGLDVVYGRDSSSIVELGIGLSYYWLSGEEWMETGVILVAGLAYNAGSDTLEPVYYRVRIGLGEEYTEAMVGGNGVRVVMPSRLLVEARSRAAGIEAGLISGSLQDILGKYSIGDGRAWLDIGWGAEPPKPLLPRPLGSPSLRFAECREGVCIGAERSLWLKDFYVYAFRARRVEEPRGLALRQLPAPPSPLTALSGIVPQALSSVVLLRHPDIGAISEPARFTGSDRLDERARNLAEVLLTLQSRRGRLPERIERALRELFPDTRIWVESRFGSVVLVGEEGGVELPPACMPDGLIKLVAIMLAAELGPSVLLIDELENSMHAKLLEYVVDELNTLPVPVIVATHSPIVVDLVEPGRVLVARKEPGRGTTVKRVGNIDELRKRLSEEGIALSDHIVYGETYS